MTHADPFFGWDPNFCCPLAGPACFEADEDSRLFIEWGPWSHTPRTPDVPFGRPQAIAAATGDDVFTGRLHRAPGFGGSGGLDREVWMARFAFGEEDGLGEGWTQTCILRFSQVVLLYAVLLRQGLRLSFLAQQKLDSWPGVDQLVYCRDLSAWTSKPKKHTRLLCHVFMPLLFAHCFPRRPAEWPAPPKPPLRRRCDPSRGCFDGSLGQAGALSQAPTLDVGSLSWTWVAWRIGEVKETRALKHKDTSWP